MPLSRRRRSKSSPDKQRHRRLQRLERLQSQRTCVTLDASGELHEQFEALMTPADIRAFRAFVEASATGDPLLAKEALLRGAVMEGSLHLTQLDELIDLGDEAPSWVSARWAMRQSYIWMLDAQDPRTDEAAMAAALYCYPDVDVERPLGQSLTEFLTRILSHDWVAHQLATYEMGGLDDFLDVKIADELGDRCGPLDLWSESPLGGYRVDGSADGFLQLLDLCDGSRRSALDIGALSGRDRGCTVIGRLVPIDVEPGWMFESRPLEVDPVTARQVARAQSVDEWLDALQEARRDDRLPLHFSRANGTPLTCDLQVDEAPRRRHAPDVPDVADDHGSPKAPAILELEAAGLDPLRANNVGVCQVALIAAQVSPEALPAVGQHLQAVLVDRRTFEAARVHLSAPEFREPWRDLAAVVPEPVRSRCLELSVLCGGDRVN